MSLEDLRKRCTFAEFVQALRDLEAAGEIEVEKWPAHETDPFKLRLTKDEDGNLIPRRLDA